ncbi:SOS response-associated peptidase family protein [Pleurotus pulmonarius]
MIASSTGWRLSAQRSASALVVDHACCSSDVSPHVGRLPILNRLLWFDDGRKPAVFFPQSTLITRLEVGTAIPMGNWKTNSIIRIQCALPNVGKWIDENRSSTTSHHEHTNIHTCHSLRQRSLSESSSQSSSNGHQDLIMQAIRWGLVPSWRKHEDKTLSTTSAKSENLVEGSGGIWGSIKGKKRCAVVAHGLYYEWLAKGKDKLPHFIKHTDSPLMLMAGLYDCATLQDSDTPLWTFTIGTTPPSLSWMHDRLPLILSSSEALRTWLDTSSQSWTPAPD